MSYDALKSRQHLSIDLFEALTSCLHLLLIVCSFGFELSLGSLHLLQRLYRLFELVGEGCLSQYVTVIVVFESVNLLLLLLKQNFQPFLLLSVQAIGLLQLRFELVDVLRRLLIASHARRLEIRSHQLGRCQLLL